MGAVIKGAAVPILVSQFPQYNAETKTYSFEYEYQGTQDAIRGLEPQLRSRGLSYRVSHNGPVWSLVVTQPLQDIEESLDRWEVSTESVEKSLFELPAIVAAAEAYDAALDDGEPTFRQACEDAVNQRAALIEAEPNAYEVIRHLRAGVTGWQLDLVSLRRIRRLEQYQAVGYPVNLDTGLYIYTTAQLDLPSAVAFAVPETPANPSDQFMWGWRKRSQRVEIVGSFAEQTVELTFAPWSLLAYEPATTNLAW